MPRKGEIDVIWETMEELFGRVVSGTNAHKKRNKAVADLKLLGATGGDLLRAFQAYQSRFSGSACTDIALATHYPLLARPANAEEAQALARRQELARMFDVAS